MYISQRYASLYAVFLCVALILTGCDSSGTYNAPDESTAYEDIGGVDIFNAVYFGSGPATDALKAVWESPEVARTLARMEASDRALINRVRDRVIPWIQKHHAGFFDRFNTEIRSGNHVRISTALEQSDQIYRQALSRNIAISGQPNPEAGPDAIRVDSKADTGIVVTEPLVATVYILPCPPSGCGTLSTESARLRSDVLVATLAEQF